MAKKKAASSSVQAFDRAVPVLAKRATRAAFNRTLKDGRTAVVVRDGELRRVYPDGRIQVIKKIARDVKVEKGTIIRIEE